MKLYSYIVRHDTGFAPNPFWGCCTLANCKPSIRRTASQGDWIVGLSRKSDGNRIVYTMKVDEIVDYAMYFRDGRFVAKRPDYRQPEVVHRCGDNIYEPLLGGGFKQLRSTHSRGVDEDPATKDHDLKGRHVLIGRKYVYFGGDGPELPPDLEVLKVRRGHKCRFPPVVVDSFTGFISQFKEGVLGRPANWPEHDYSWRQRKS